MSAVELPVIDGSVSLGEAYDKLKASGKSGLVVVSPDGPRLFHSDALELQLSHHAAMPVQDAAGGHWLPDTARPTRITPEGTGEPTVSIAGGTAILEGLTKEAARGLNYAVRVFACNLDPTNHTYTAAEYKALPSSGGIRYCKTKDGGIVS